MTTFVFIIILCAAILHASWNALVKGGQDKFINMTAIILGHAPITLALLPFVPIPHPDSYPLLIIGIFFHIGYQVFLTLSYRVGDLSQVYPIARGIAPVIVTMISVFFLEVALTNIQIAAILSIAFGIIILSFTKSKQIRKTNYQIILFAIMTGIFIAGYSMIDGYGARTAGTAIGFYAWLSVGNVIIYAVIMALWKPYVLPGIWHSGKRKFILGGSASFIAYAIVIWAFTQAPIAFVTAIRETSIIVAMLIGIFILRESFNWVKILSILLTVMGLILLKLS